MDNIEQRVKKIVADQLVQSAEQDFLKFLESVEGF